MSMATGVNVNTIIGDPSNIVDDGFDFFDVWNRSKIFIPFGNASNPISEAKSVNNIWWWSFENNSDFRPRKIDTPTENLVLMAEHAPYWVAKYVASHRRATVEVIEAILRNRCFTFEETIDICCRLTSNKATPAHVIETMYQFTQTIAYCKANGRIARHKNSPANVLKDFLPTHVNDQRNNLDWEVVQNAATNRNCPSVDALKASKFMFGDEGEFVWAARFPDFVVEHKNLTGVDVSDWPVEWVEELIK